jgi:hypothetical protein
MVFYGGVSENFRHENGERTHPQLEGELTANRGPDMAN